MCFGDSSNLYAGVCNVWSTTVSDLRETGIAHGRGLEKYQPSSVRSRPLQKSIGKKMAVDLNASFA